MGQATDGQLPADSLGYRAEGVYVPGVGTVAQQGVSVGTDAQGTNYGATAQFPTAAPVGGATYYHLVSAATTNATVVKASPGTLYQVTLNCNTSAAARYLKFYDTASTPTAGSGTIVYVVQAPLLAASTGSTITVTFPVGLAFTVGIAFVTVTTLADSGSTGVGAGDLSIDLAYK